MAAVQDAARSPTRDDGDLFHKNDQEKFARPRRRRRTLTEEEKHARAENLARAREKAVETRKRRAILKKAALQQRRDEEKAAVERYLESQRDTSVRPTAEQSENDHSPPPKPSNNRKRKSREVRYVDGSPRYRYSKLVYVGGNSPGLRRSHEYKRRDTAHSEYEERSGTALHDESQARPLPTPPPSPPKATNPPPSLPKATKPTPKVVGSTPDLSALLNLM